MDWTAITQLISSVGFPIVACVAMFSYMGKQDEKHREEINKISTALDNNTVALQKLIDKIEQ